MVERRKWIGGVEEMKVTLRIIAHKEFLYSFLCLGIFEIVHAASFEA